MSSNQSPAVKVAKKVKGNSENDGIHTLSTGVRARLVPVATALMDEIRRSVPEPDIPMWENPDKGGRKEPNPADPDYHKAISEAENKRGFAVFDALVLLGVELVDDMPDDNTWITKLKLLEKHGLIDLSSYDLDDPIEKEFLYKKHIAVSNADFELLSQVTGLTAAEVQAQEELFPG